MADLCFMRLKAFTISGGGGGKLLTKQKQKQTIIPWKCYWRDDNVNTFMGFASNLERYHIDAA